MSFENFKIKNLYNLEACIAGKIFDKLDYPWEALPLIKDFILELGARLGEDFDKIGEDIWVAKSAKIAPTASITGPCIIDENAEIRHCAFIRGSAVIGKSSVVGNSTEIKNAILFDNVQVPHFNYVGDSILGNFSHMGAGAVTSNVKSDKSPVAIKYKGQSLDTARKKVGAFLGDRVEIGCNSVLCPGTVIGKNSTVYPTSCVRGAIDANSIFKNSNTIISKE